MKVYSPVSGRDDPEMGVVRSVSTRESKVARTNKPHKLHLYSLTPRFVPTPVHFEANLRDFPSWRHRYVWAILCFVFALTVARMLCRVKKGRYSAFRTVSIVHFCSNWSVHRL